MSSFGRSSNLCYFCYYGRVAEAIYNLCCGSYFCYFCASAIACFCGSFCCCLLVSASEERHAENYSKHKN